MELPTWCGPPPPAARPAPPPPKDRFAFDAPPDLVAWDCDCSICAMKRNTHAIVPEARFRLLQGEESLSRYQFGTMTAKHLFCKTCGICAFYRPRSNPDGYAVTIHCITSPSVRSITVKQIRGSDWENAVAASGIQGLSKLGGGGGGGARGE